METTLASHINGLLLRASWSEELQRQSGLAMASQEWSEAPGWYLWPHQGGGAYNLSLREVFAEAGGRAAGGLFTIKYYPPPESSLAGLYSPLERALLKSESFDHTNTPVFEAQDELPDHLFTVGSLELVLDENSTWSLCSLSALETCLEYHGGQPVRRVPGWELSHHLYSTLLCLTAQHGRMQPLGAHGLSGEGFEMAGLDSEQLAPRPSPNPLYSLSVLMGQATFGPPPLALELMERDLAQAEGEILFKGDYSCGHCHGPVAEMGGIPALNEKWWSLAGAEFKSHLASSCGCEH